MFCYSLGKSTTNRYVYVQCRMFPHVSLQKRPAECFARRLQSPLHNPPTRLRPPLSRWGFLHASSHFLQACFSKPIYPHLSPHDGWIYFSVKVNHDPLRFTSSSVVISLHMTASALNSIRGDTKKPPQTAAAYLFQYKDGD